jgi:hypothetical protein
MFGVSCVPHGALQEALLSLQDWIRQHKDRGIQPVISNPSRQVMRLLERAHIPQLIGEEYITVRVNDAVLLCKVHLVPSVAFTCMTISALCSCHGRPASLCALKMEQ